MRVPLFTPIDDPAGKKLLTKRSCFGPCQRKVKTCLSLIFCLALLFICIYLDIVTILFWDTLKHSPERSLPLWSSLKIKKEKMLEDPAINETLNLEARNKRLRQCLKLIKKNSKCFLRDVLNLSLVHWLTDLPAMDKDWCQRMTHGQLTAEEVSRIANWNVNQSSKSYLPDRNKLNPIDMPEAGLEIFSQILTNIFYILVAVI